MVKKKRTLKTLKIYDDTHEELARCGSKGETFDEVIQKLVKKQEIKKHSKEIIKQVIRNLDIFKKLSPGEDSTLEIEHNKKLLKKVLEEE